MEFLFVSEPDDDNQFMQIADVKFDRKLIIKKLNWYGATLIAESTDDELADMVGELELKARSIDELMAVTRHVFSLDCENK